MPSSFKANGEEATESNCNDEDNTLTFDFSGTLNDSAVSEGGGDDGICTSGIVKVYDCSTKTTTDCCPDKKSCEQPACSCDDDGDCPGDQICDDGICGCPLGWDYEKGMLGPDGITCCFNGHSWDEDEEHYTNETYELCGCPDGGTFGTDDETCCLNGYSWNELWEEYHDKDFELCGYPD